MRGKKSSCNIHIWTCPGSNRTPLASQMLSERDNQLHHMPYTFWGFVVCPRTIRNIVIIIPPRPMCPVLVLACEE